MATHDCDALVKVMLIGDGAVGKSSLMLRYCENKFDPRHMMTIGVDFKTKVLQVDGERIRLQIWDTAGQERFRNITPVYFRNSNGVALVFDVSNVDSFENVTYWLASLENHGSADKPRVLVGNKIDLVKRKVTRRRAEALAARHNIPYYETSALNNVGIDLVFESLCRSIRATNAGGVTKRAFHLEAPAAPDDALMCCGAPAPKFIQSYWGGKGAATPPPPAGSTASSAGTPSVRLVSASPAETAAASPDSKGRRAKHASFGTAAAAASADSQ